MQQGEKGGGLFGGVGSKAPRERLGGDSDTAVSCYVAQCQ